MKEQWRSSCPQAEEIGAYLLDALEPGEAASFGRHLQQCPKCQTEVAALAFTLGLIATSVPQLAAPRRLKRRILEAVAGRDGAANRRRLLPPGAWFRLAVATALGAGAVAGALLLAGSPQVRTLPLRFAVQMRSATGFLREEENRGLLRINGMPPAPRGEVYEVWLAPPRGAPVPAETLFTVRQGQVVSVPIHRSLAGAKVVMVTVEPAGGTLKPTSPPILSVAL